MHIECETSARNIPLDDIIDNLLLFPDSGQGSFYERKTITYELGTKHGLFDAMWGAQ